jgi:hypothetical protein
LGCFEHKAFSRSKQKPLLNLGNLRFFACLSQKRKYAVYSMQHRGKRSVDSLEFRKARSFCFAHSKLTLNGENEFSLRRLKKLWLLLIKLSMMLDFVSDTPQGLVLADNRCEGFFSSNS